MSCGCNGEGREFGRDFERDCDGRERGDFERNCDGRRFSCRETIRRVERDVRQLNREIDDVERTACRLRRNVRNLDNACLRRRNDDWDWDWDWNRHCRHCCHRCCDRCCNR